MEIYEKKQSKLKIVLKILLILVIFGIGYMVAIYFPIDVNTIFQDNQTETVVVTPTPTATVDPEFDSLVPSLAVADSYFDDAVFIGNSRMKGFMLYSGLENTQSITDVGMTVETAVEEPLVIDGTDKITVIEKLATYDYNKIYIMLGTNELGWPYMDLFIEKYVTFIDEVKAVNPDAIIYICAIMPVNEAMVDVNKPYQNNENIQEFNRNIKKMCDEQHIYFIDSYSAMVNDNNELEAEESFDGVHLQVDACQQLLAYLKIHVVEKENDNEENIDLN